MAFRELNRYRWQALRIYHRLGLSVLVALMLLVVSMAIIFQAHQLARQCDYLRSQINNVPATSLLPVAMTNTERLNAFFENLPDEDQASNRVKRLFLLAEKNQVQLAKGEYQWSKDSLAKVIEYRILLPMKGNSENIQTFVLNALMEIPTLTLDTISFRRENAQKSEIEGNIHFRLIMKPRK